MHQGPSTRAGALGVVVFTGGRGSGALVRQLVARKGVSLTLAINGYDDGASTGQVRRFLRDSLGPSDFRKNASRVARELLSAPEALIDALDRRLGAGTTAEAALAELEALAREWPPLAPYIDAFIDEYRRRGDFTFDDCSVGNIVFAGAYLAAGRDFNAAVDRYCALLSLPDGLIENVTDGRNAHLVALDAEGRLLRTEEAIVDGRRQNTIDRIFLVDRVPSEAEARAIERMPRDEAIRALEARRPGLALNPRLARKIAGADVIIYAPGTQHSSLFPSYLTPGLGDAIGSNLRAIKLLLTNIQTDAEIAGSTAVDLVDRALRYLRHNVSSPLPAPCLITHYLMNEPGRAETAPYVQLGPVELMEDPRLVRIGAYEDGVSGLHDAARVLEPFIDTLLAPRRTTRIAVLLHDSGSVNKTTESMLEMVRGGIQEQPIDVVVFCLGAFDFDPHFTAGLPFDVRVVPDAPQFLDAVREGEFDYVGLFESSGMYRGEDLVALLAQLTDRRLDAVWGSRRLSVRDIQESYRYRYRSSPVLGAVSFVGSHVLSLACLVLYGRYMSDTLSAVWAVRASDALEVGTLTDRMVNERLLARLLRRRASVLEMPVHFMPISPDRVRRTSALEGLHALVTLISLWL
ncbi:MAG TPA: 2-phospho-L-lactate transferase CofD family protein [Vicinamibacterales bacterium]|nr:2-phospho-L-lactate transferase CofD family protein [Vicinamibacterales bacterium]